MRRGTTVRTAGWWSPPGPCLPKAGFDSSGRAEEKLVPAAGQVRATGLHLRGAAPVPRVFEPLRAASGSSDPGLRSPGRRGWSGDWCSFCTLTRCWG